jgi:hypothetical protein
MRERKIHPSTLIYLHKKLLSKKTMANQHSAGRRKIYPIKDVSMDMVNPDF